MILTIILALVGGIVFGAVVVGILYGWLLPRLATSTFRKPGKGVTPTVTGLRRDSGHKG